MDNIGLSARSDVTVASTAPRVTPTPARVPFKEVLTKTVVRTAETAMSVLPGAPLMAVAVRGAAGGIGSIGVPVGGTGAARSGSPEGPGAGARGVGGGIGLPNVSLAPGVVSGANGAGGAAGGSGADAAAPSIEQSLAQSQEMNLYYLQIQETVNAQNRTFSTLSNVLKAEHDTVKTAIGNIR